jgi:hypothetical protein
VQETGLSDVEVRSCDVAEQPIETGEDARCFSQYMRIHVLEASGGRTYAEMGRFVAAGDPENPAGTSDEEAALTDEEGNPVPNTRPPPPARCAGARAASSLSADTREAPGVCCSRLASGQKPLSGLAATRRFFCDEAAR